jgi:hypothetical protein
LFVFLLAAHLHDAGVLWAEEDLPLAAALQMTHGSVLYQDVWFDKPPLVAAVYLLWGAKIGAVLRIAGAMYVWIACLLAYFFAARMWTRREGYWAAGLLAFFLTFDTHSAVMPLAADSLLLVPHLAAVLLASKKQAFWAGMAAGIGFLFNVKGLFVLAACALFAWPDVIALAAGFVLPNLVALGWIAGAGALGPYVDQVWRWPTQYAASPIVADPVRNGFVKTLGWLGFHTALVIGAVLLWWRRTGWKFLAWFAICYVGVVLGWRFFPRYFFLVLPALTLAAARGISLWKPRWPLYATLALAMAVPLVRFARVNPNDLALDRDSREVSSLAPKHGTLYVWGYRPEIYVYTGLRPATRFLDSQAMTGVPADRHLTQSGVVLTKGTREAREELAQSRPDVLIDGLGLYNPALAMDRYPELRPWLAQYREVARTKGSIIYVRHPTTIGR